MRRRVYFLIALFFAGAIAALPAQTTNAAI
jgi:hypothetical protein